MSDLAKTFSYLKRNGIVKTAYAVKERVDEKKTLSYPYAPISEEERLRELEESLRYQTTFSIVVPAYETPEPFLRAMLDSVTAQTYTKWELWIADASLTDTVKNIVKDSTDVRIRYLRLSENKGISGNTKEALRVCTGDYIGLLDHDDLLTKNALYEMAKNIARAERFGIQLQMLYSDEDKTDAENTTFFEFNKKPKFNLDLILSNNYICHFLMLKAELFKELSLRSDYDGAQDHDLILRAVGRLRAKHGADYEAHIYHIGKVLYHWRAHSASTALNPKSKDYAYEAGRRAVADFLHSQGIEADVTHSAHRGFYDVSYKPDIFACRKDVCAIGGRITDSHGRVIGGAYDETKKLLFEGLSYHHSGGYLHRADCRMEVPYLDLSCMQFSPYRETEAAQTPVQILNRMLEGNRALAQPVSDKELAFRFCDAMRSMGYKFLYDPAIIIKKK